MVWQEYNLKDWSEEKQLPDGRIVYNLNKSQFLEQVSSAFTDPIVRREELSVSVFNIGEKQNLADQTADIIEQMGVRVVEIGDKEIELEEGCLIKTNKEYDQSFTVHRLRKIFGCKYNVGEIDSLGKIQFYIKNVKI